ncbi:MAG TPA: hypothetical protein VGR37_20770 [Longimicrobiaceae bacterium]|nr:hypothetical protein [Longimicrobiaceae bacterium]
MKKLAFLPLAVLAFTACSDLANPVTAPESGSFGVASPMTLLNAQIVISTGGAAGYRSSGPGNNGKGECFSSSSRKTNWVVMPGFWRNPEDNTTSDKPHAQCYGSGGGEVLDFQMFVNWVLPSSGSQNLNFQGFAGEDAETGEMVLTEAVTAAVHYNAQKKTTKGSGGFTYEGWTIDFSTINTTGNLLANQTLQHTACHATIGCRPVLLDWSAD